MTRNSRPTIEPVDESWVAHLRDLSTGVAPPTSANPHAMSRTVIRRTRTRRAVLTSGGGVLTVAAVAGAAFALSGPTAPGVLMPGGSTSATGTPTSASEEEKRAAAHVPDGWEAHQIEGLSYALPAEIVPNEPSHDEPGEQSAMWHHGADPDAAPFIRLSYVTPGYEFYDTAAGGLTQTPGAEATPFELAGASVASLEDGGSNELRQITAMPTGSGVEPVRILVHRADGPGRYVITMTLPSEDSERTESFDEDFVQKFQDSLSLD